MEDKQLERLYDYTKFHIGIYLSAAGGLAALISTAAEGSKAAYIGSLIGSPMALATAFAFMVLAGIAGAVVATSTIENSSYVTFLKTKQGAYGIEPFVGRTWITIEHACFWFSLVALGIGVFSSPAVCKWLFGSRHATYLYHSLG